jgi:copper resistance protein C
MMSRSLAARLLLALLAALALVASAVGPASAHNALLSSTPSDGEAVSRTPEAVVLVFDDSAIAMGAQVVVTGPSGPVQTGSPTVVGNSAQQPLAAGAPAGNYTVAWRVISGDGHPITGTFQFTAREAGGGQAPPEASPSQVTNQTGGALARSGPLVVAAIVLAAATGVFLSRKRRRTPGELP